MSRMPKMMLSSSITVEGSWLVFRIRVMVYYVLFRCYPDHPHPLGHLHLFAHKNNFWPLGISLPIFHCPLWHLAILGAFAYEITEDVIHFIARPCTFAKEYCKEPFGIQGSERNQSPGSLDSMNHRMILNSNFHHRLGQLQPSFF